VRRSLFTLLALGANGCAEHTACMTQALSVAPSPGGDLKAVVFVRSCGPHDVTVNLSILPRAEELEDGRGNTLVLAMNQAQGTIAFPKASWQDQNHLVVRLDTTLAVRRSEAEAAAVRVHYLTQTGDPIPGMTP
jgi:hypothetical protein